MWNCRTEGRQPNTVALKRSAVVGVGVGVNDDLAVTSQRHDLAALRLARVSFSALASISSSVSGSARRANNCAISDRCALASDMNGLMTLLTLGTLHCERSLVGSVV